MECINVAHAAGFNKEFYGYASITHDNISVNKYCTNYKPNQYIPTEGKLSTILMRKYIKMVYQRVYIYMINESKDKIV